MIFFYLFVFMFQKLFGQFDGDRSGFMSSFELRRAVQAAGTISLSIIWFLLTTCHRQRCLLQIDVLHIMWFSNKLNLKCYVMNPKNMIILLHYIMIEILTEGVTVTNKSDTIVQEPLDTHRLIVHCFLQVLS